MVVLWAIKLIEKNFGINLSGYGLYPRDLGELTGILTSPLVHGDYNHLISNSLPLLVLGGMMFYFYRPISFLVFFWIYIMSGLWLWAAGRGEAPHIGASGLVYGFASFLFFSGIFRKERTLMVLSMLVVFLYGSLVWGVLPIDPKISWESHLLGSLAGIITAFYFRKEGPQAKKIVWDEDEEDDGEWKIENEDSEKPPAA